MNRILAFAITARGADRRSTLYDPEARPGTPGEDKSRLEVRRWRYAWDAAWQRPAPNADELLTRAKLLLADSVIEEDSDEAKRLVRNVIFVLGRRTAA